MEAARHLRYVLERGAGTVQGEQNGTEDAREGEWCGASGGGQEGLNVVLVHSTDQAMQNAFLKLYNSFL